MPSSGDTPASNALSVYRPQSAALDITGVDRIASMFIKGAVLAKAVWAVTGPDGLTSVPSQVTADAQAYLFWSSHHEASRWADVLTEAPHLVAIDLPAFIAETVPAIAASGGVLATDWCADGEPELAAEEVRRHLQTALVGDFVHVAVKTRSVFVLRDLDGIAAVPTVDGRGPVVPVWTDRSMAETVAGQAGGFVTAVRMPLPELTNRYLLSSQGVRSRLAPAYVPAPLAPIYSPWEFKALINGGGSPAVLRVA